MLGQYYSSGHNTPSWFQPRLIVHQESISAFLLREILEMVLFLVYLLREGGTGYDGVAATSSPRGTLPVPPSLFSKGKETESPPRFHFRFVDPILDMESLLLPL
jgi:hypothetical protein